MIPVPGFSLILIFVLSLIQNWKWINFILIQVCHMKIWHVKLQFLSIDECDRLITIQFYFKKLPLKLDTSCIISRHNYWNPILKLFITTTCKLPHFIKPITINSSSKSVFIPQAIVMLHLWDHMVEHDLSYQGIIDLETTIIVLWFYTTKIQVSSLLYLY